MSCCGNKRGAFAPNHTGAVSGGYVTPKMWPDVSFEYTGATGLSVTGSVSGKRYRFSGPGAILRIDYRDANGMMAVPMLRLVREDPEHSE